MSRYYKGMKIRTSYGSTDYIIKKITENCTCPRFLDTLNLRENAPESKPHVHLVVTPINGKGECYLNGYDENLRSVWNNDYLIDLNEISPAILLLI